MAPATSHVSDRPLRRRGTVSVARALGSSTRAGIYAHLQEAAAALTVRDIAGAFDLHPNVARTHLETLADAGLVVVGRRKHPGGGRPAKLYLARDDVPVTPEARPDDAGRQLGAATLLVRLLASLLDEPARSSGVAQLARAHETAAAEGRRLAAAVGEGGLEGGLEAVAQTAIRALAPSAPEARVVKAGRDWVDVVGVRGMFRTVGGVRPELADALERGLLSGALAGAGIPVTLADAGTAPGGGQMWRARAIAQSGNRAPIDPDAHIDARGLQREAGVVKAMRAVTALQPGEILEVLAEGPGSPAAFARWADRAGHELLGVERAVDDEGRPGIRLLIRKGA